MSQQKGSTYKIILVAYLRFEDMTNHQKEGALLKIGLKLGKKYMTVPKSNSKQRVRGFLID